MEYLRNCNFCNKEFTAHRIDGKYCCRRCKSKFENKNRPKRNNIYFKCAFCGSYFLQKRKDNLVCSTKCQSKYYRKRNIDKIKIKQKQYNFDHRYEKNIKFKQYYNDNKEKLSQKNREWRDKNAENLKKYRREYRYRANELRKKYCKDLSDSYIKSLIYNKYRIINPPKEFIEQKRAIIKLNRTIKSKQNEESKINTR